MNGLPTVTLVDSSGVRHPLRYLFTSPSFSIIVFHDSMDILPRLAEIGALTANTCVVLTSSWFRGDVGSKNLVTTLERTDRVATAGFISKKNALVVANSDEELINLRCAGLDARIVRSNNCCFLDESNFSVSQEAPIYDTVLNSKPLRFKRHELSAAVKNKVFITYDAAEGGDADYKVVDIDALSPTAIFRNIDSQEVARILGKSETGLILSQREGACYASAEYLLSGLPVISPPSQGGRDDFYDYKTAVIVPPTPEGVAQGVAEAIERLRNGQFNRQEIRQRTIERFTEFRRSFGTVLSRLAANNGVSLDGYELIVAAVRRGSKLSADRNFWITNVVDTPT